MNESDKARIDWCISVLRGVADSCELAGLYEGYQHSVMVIDALKRVLQPDLEGE